MRIAGRLIRQFVVVAAGLGAFLLSPLVWAGMGIEEARHLLERTGFGVAPAEVARFARLRREQAVDELLARVQRRAVVAPPAWAERYERVFRPDMTPEERQQANRRELLERGLELRAWWVAEMLATPSPLTERMTLFWHNHFATSQQKVRSAYLMYRQNVLLREHALGNFAVLLRELAKDPAMLIYLDGAQNRRDAPNENFAREVMELFTLGEGRYSEQDVKEAARALTGWSVDLETGQFRFRPALHDPGEKTILGQRGRFTGEDLVRLLAEQPATAEFITTKLWREFVGEPLPEDRAEIERLAAAFRTSGLELKPLVRGILLSERFWLPERRGTLVKSPVDLVIGTLRGFGVVVEDPMPFAIVLRQLGQDLFAPPNVKGWPSGEAWLTTSTLMARKSFLDRLFRAEEQPMLGSRMSEAQGGRVAGSASALVDLEAAGSRPGRARMRRSLRAAAGPMGAAVAFDAQAFLARFGVSGEDEARERAIEHMLALKPVHAAQLAQAREALAFLRALALDPAYQLK
ncbi:MAG: DUF1800 domain-containing protein [Casimicrobiaceae bacterium]|nr:DUF1800 domain-containing protein [Casimicrobiaceae bacterium]